MDCEACTKNEQKYLVMYNNGCLFNLCEKCFQKERAKLMKFRKIEDVEERWKKEVK